MVHSAFQTAAVYFQLGFAGASGADAACLLAETDAHPPQPRQQIAKLGELHLSFAFHAGGVLSEDVQDDRRAIYSRATEHLFQCCLLGGA